VRASGARGQYELLGVSKAWYRDRDAPVLRQCFEIGRERASNSVPKPANSRHRLARGTFHRVRQNSTIVVNATLSGLFPDTNDRLDIDLDSLQPHLIVADVIPNPPRTQLLRDAEGRACATLATEHVCQDALQRQ